MASGLYLHFDEVGNPRKSGIRNKIDGQLKAFRNEGYDTDVIYFRSKKELFRNDQKILRLPSRQLIFRFFIFRKILKICMQNNYGFIYIRYAKSDPYFLHFLKRAKSPVTKIFIEFPTFPYDSEMDPKNMVERLMNRQDRKYRDRLNKYVDYAASIVNLPYDILKIPTFHIDNGVDLETITPVDSIPAQNHIRIIGVANISRWHAWDRVILGLHQYYQNPSPNIKVTFKIIGSGSAGQTLKSLCEELGMGEYVKFQGPRMGPDLDLEFQTADIAMGSLGMHRIGLNSGSVLKLREYTARGIPSVIGYHDSMVSGDEPFLFQIPSDESPLEIDQLITFFQGIKVSAASIRKFAEDHFSWSTVLKPVFEKI